MVAVIGSILFAVLVFLSSASAEEVNITSLYLEQNGSFIWLNGDVLRVNKLVENFTAKGFVEKGEGRREVVCIIDTFGVLAVGEERGTAVTCGKNANFFDVRNNDPQYMEKVVEHVHWFVQYVRSPFTGEAEKNLTSFRNDKEKSCIFVEMQEFKKDKEGAKLYESQSRDRFILLQQTLEEIGYVEKQANWTLCNAKFVKWRCVLAMDHIEGRQLMPVKTVISCFDMERTRVLEDSVKNDLPVEEYVKTVLNTVQEHIHALSEILQEGTETAK